MSRVLPPDSQRSLLLALLGLSGGLFVWFYQNTLLTILAKWGDDTAYSHGYLILPIVLWLLWNKRQEIRSVAFSPSWTGALVMVLCTAGWVVARGSGVLVIEQFAAVAMVPTLVLAVLGRPVFRTLIFPLTFLMLMVPFGRAIVPGLMHVTADIATVLLEWTGIPVLRSHMYLSIPAGSFEVARACSGLNYFTTGLVLGLLYAYLNFRSWGKRITCVIAFIVLPIVLNGVRVYITILVSHLTDMRFGPGAEHATFGQIFFVVVMVALFWFGRRWHEDAVPSVPALAEKTADPGLSFAALAPVVVAVIAMMAAPSLFAASVNQMRFTLSDAGLLVRMPDAQKTWQGPQDGQGRWRPLYQGGVVERQALYRMNDGKPLDVFVAVYGLGTTIGTEMISFSNVLFAEERGSLAKDQRRVVTTPDGDTFKVREVVVENNETRQLVWQWFVVGERPVVSPFAAKALEAIAFITRGAHSERIVTLGTPMDDGAQGRLQAFVDTYGRCVVAGFPTEDCGE